jgi:hypothetical protein
MHLEVLVGAVAKQLRAARSEVGEAGDELLGRRGRDLLEMQGGLGVLLLLVGGSLLAVHHRGWRRPSRQGNTLA